MLSLSHLFLSDNLSPEANATVHEKWCNDLAAKLLCIFVLDRFSDFVSDQVSNHDSPCHWLLRYISGDCTSTRDGVTNSGIINTSHAPQISSTCSSRAVADDPSGFQCKCPSKVSKRN